MSYFPGTIQKGTILGVGMCTMQVSQTPSPTEQDPFHQFHDYEFFPSYLIECRVPSHLILNNFFFFEGIILNNLTLDTQLDLQYLI